VQLRHEVWRNPDDESFEFAIASQRADEVRGAIAPKSELLHVIYAASWEEAMTAYHEWQGWEPYKPIPGVTDRLYDDGWLRREGIVISRS